MIVMRTTFQASLSRGGEMAVQMGEAQRAMMQELGLQRRWRVLADLSGPLDTVVLEVDAESLAGLEQTRPRVFASQTLRESMARG